MTKSSGQPGRIKAASLLTAFVLGSLASPFIYQETFATAAPAQPDATAGGQQPVVTDQTISQVSSLGKIIDQSIVPEKSGVIAWNIQAPNNQKLTVYTTSDGLLVMGSIWDLATKQQLNHSFGSGAAGMPAPQQNLDADQVAAAQVGGNGSFVGEFKGETPESIKAVDSLAGVKLGNGDMNNTLYIIIDPRCPYCHTAYENLKPYMDKGLSVNIIPTVALGNPQQGAPMASAILKAKTRQEMDNIMLDPKSHSAPLTDEISKALDTNLMFMYAAFEKSKQRPGVPVVFFSDRTTGKGRMVMGISEPAVVKEILGN